MLAVTVMADSVAELIAHQISETPLPLGAPLETSLANGELKLPPEVVTLEIEVAPPPEDGPEKSSMRRRFAPAVENGAVVIAVAFVAT